MERKAGQVVPKRRRRGVTDSPHRRWRASTSTSTSTATGRSPAARLLGTLAATSSTGTGTGTGTGSGAYACARSRSRDMRVFGRKHERGEAQLQVVVGTQHGAELPRGLRGPYCARTRTSIRARARARARVATHAAAPHATTAPRHIAVPGTAGGAGAGGADAHLEKSIAQRAPSGKRARRLVRIDGSKHRSKHSRRTDGVRYR